MIWRSKNKEKNIKRKKKKNYENNKESRDFVNQEYEDLEQNKCHAKIIELMIEKNGQYAKIIELIKGTKCTK